MKKVMKRREKEGSMLIQKEYRIEQEMYNMNYKTLNSKFRMQ